MVKVNRESYDSPCDGQQPQILANWDASDEFIFRDMVSSGKVGLERGRKYGYRRVLRLKREGRIGRTNDIPEDVEAGHDTDEKDLSGCLVKRTWQRREGIERTRYLNATPPATNQKSTIRPDMPRMRTHVLCDVAS